MNSPPLADSIHIHFYEFGSLKSEEKKTNGSLNYKFKDILLILMSIMDA